MIFVDTNVFMFSLGKPHHHREPARQFLRASLRGEEGLVTSAEVLQELLHVYFRRNDPNRIQAALDLCQREIRAIWSLEAEDVFLARDLIGGYPELQARDLVHLASCRRRGIGRIATFDRKLAAAFEEPIDWTSYGA